MIQLAAQLAFKQDLALLDAFVKTSDERLTPLWRHLIQEIILKGAEVSNYPNLLALARSIQQSEHPFSVLPLHLLSVETELKDYQR